MTLNNKNALLRFVNDLSNDRYTHFKRDILVELIDILKDLKVKRLWILTVINLLEELKEKGERTVGLVEWKNSMILLFEFLVYEKTDYEPLVILQSLEEEGV